MISRNRNNWQRGPWPPEGVLELLLAKNPSCFRLSKLASREHAFLYSRCLFKSAQPTAEKEGELFSIWKAFTHRLHSLHMLNASLTPENWMRMSSRTYDPKSVWLSLPSCAPELGDARSFGGYSGGRETQDYKLHWASILNPAQLRDCPLPPLLPPSVFF